MRGNHCLAFRVQDRNEDIEDSLENTDWRDLFGAAEKHIPIFDSCELCSADPMLPNLGSTACFQAALARIRLTRGALRTQRDPDPAPSPVRLAILKTLTSQGSSNERTWVARVEDFRRRLDRSEEPIAQNDPGVGVGGRESSKAPLQVEMTTIGKMSRGASSSRVWARLLFNLVRQRQPETALELGTALGVSAAYQAAALTLNGHGTLTTIEAHPARVAIASAGATSLGLRGVDYECGLFQDVLPGILERIGPIDYAFIDGHHDEVATASYFDQIVARASPSAILIFDDISWSAGMRRAWQTIVSDPRLAWSLDLTRIGICVTRC
jgi:predicted O-methyltransferase YrrM